MTRLLPALHEGHAPIYLHRAFSDALDAFDDWAPGAGEPLVDYEDGAVPISSVFGRMRTCTDRLPSRVLELVTSLAPSMPVSELDADPTYADAARVMRALCVERLRRAAAAG